MQDPETRTEIFFSYAHKDEKLRNELEKHLMNLRLIASWHDRKIGPGKEWENEIDAHLNAAEIILLLISPDFMASDYCNSIEVKRAMERYKNGEALVIPIILRPVEWENALFGKLQALPPGARPVTSQNRDKAFSDIAKGIRKAIEGLNKKPSTTSKLNLSTGFDSTAGHLSDIFNELADMTVRLGGQKVDGRLRWRFCCILLPKDPIMPLQQQSIVIQARSKETPPEFKVGTTTISLGEPVMDLSFRAFQSAYIIYRPNVPAEYSIFAHREFESSIRSAIAVPVGGEYGQPIAILYMVSDEVDAFSEGDQRLLRIMGVIVEGLIRTYHTQHLITEKLTSIITNPSIVDISFKDFLSGDEFIRDVEALLTNIKTQMEQGAEQLIEGVVSFISIDVDNPSTLESNYGYEKMKNLRITIGLKVKEMIKAFITKHTNCKLYYMYAGRYYLLLKGIPLEKAQAKAEAMRRTLVRHISTFVLADVTVRLGVTSYTYKKLEEHLASDNPINIVAEVREKIAHALGLALDIGSDYGGNIVMTWEYDIGGFVPWPPKKVE